MKNNLEQLIEHGIIKIPIDCIFLLRDRNFVPQ